MAKGVIKRLLRDKGFGFIKARDGTDIFFHRRALENTRFDLLKEGDLVEFKVVKEPKGPKAVHIKVKEV